MSYSVASIVRDAQHAAGQGRDVNPFPTSEEAGQIWAAAFAEESDRRKKAQAATVRPAGPADSAVAHRAIPAHIAGAL